MRVRASEHRAGRNANALVITGAVMGVVDRAGGAVGEDCNGGGARVDGMALAFAVVDGESLERSASRAVVAYVEINISADRNRGSGEGNESPERGGCACWRPCFCKVDVMMILTSGGARRWLRTFQDVERGCA